MGKLLIVAWQYSLSLCFPVALRNNDKARSGTIDKMADIFTKRIWQP